MIFLRVEKRMEYAGAVNSEKKRKWRRKHISNGEDVHDRRDDYMQNNLLLKYAGNKYIQIVLQMSILTIATINAAAWQNLQHLQQHKKYI